MKNLYWLVIACLLSTNVTAQNAVEIEQKIDLVYSKVGSWEGKLDLYLPKSKQKNTLVIYIHGGGWTHGNKEAEYEKIKVFIENGFAVANVEYRLATQSPAPAAIEDVNCAISYLLKNADQFHFDPKKVVLIGGSAGAHLALLAGLQSNRPIFNGTCKLKSFKVAAIISKYGPTDLLTWKAATDPKSASSSWLGNRLADSTFIKSLSPINYTSGCKIPVLFIHGDQDKTVPIEQSQALFQKLTQLGCPTELYVVKNGKHGNFGDIETPKMDAKMLAFLGKYVK